MLTKTLSEISPVDVQQIKQRAHILTIGVLIFIFLFNFYFWKINNKLKKEEKKIQTL